MSISEILKKEATNIGDIILFKDGIFWRAYERSAYLFTTHVKPYQLTKRYFKNVGCEVVFCGFPNTTLDELLAKVSTKEVVREDNKISIAGFEPIENEVFMVWKNGIQTVVKQSEIEHYVCDNGYNSKEVILQSLRNFRVASSTPIECQQFLMEMQKQLDGTV
ncbi:MAG TPA: hypothetical protein PLF12_11060 [Tenuifilum sp.]|mgnify:FL=1|uniref:hypothetical protein n=1 Tax=Tenuifilum sp. TaxID=2760880 RepID=UPI002B667600|nr:hypothetical protein [Tenuifilum sp.]